jgi:Lipase
MPGCAIVNEVKGAFSSVCSHIRAVEYFAESVENPQAFVAVAADSYRKFKNKIFDKNNLAYMGIACRSKYVSISRL